MPGFGDIVQKAFYLGVGIADYATEKAGKTLNELRKEAQKLADEMVKRGEMNAEEARKFVDDLVRQAQTKETVKQSQDNTSREPRRIEILSDDDEENSANPDDKNVNDLRDRVQSLQDELRRLKRDS
ncbi:MAG: hypothetical protein SAL07_10140 [Oscillatoria sp. PMC 1051.18]|uniref:phasin family protein n=1 Tax=Oscillatoria salina TaxID=331517 RepID=UPI001CCC5C87|nr:hypothetical protein [Oscillatoria salina]MBZ8183054.1 hypothetical protein [Oscillatoria salina IIICB1]MEC4893542.1 hypothetical protein [Oscillatoria sp. PMC 1050.18]MEC5030263.1 hypothetical protein [Oscillatoria sp. PMC 1051.18]